MSDVNMSDFMGVLQASVQTETGIMFPGANMPSGNPVVAEGVTMAELMTDKGMAETWYESIKGAYEREKEERDHASSTADTPDLVIRGHDDAPGESGGGEVAAQVGGRTLEEELQARQEEWQARVHELGPALEEAVRNLTNVEAALAAISDGS